VLGTLALSEHACCSILFDGSCCIETSDHFVTLNACKEGCGVAVACQSQSGDKGDHNIEQMLPITVAPADAVALFGASKWH